MAWKDAGGSALGASRGIAASVISGGILAGVI